MLSLVEHVKSFITSRPGGAISLLILIHGVDKNSVDSVQLAGFIRNQLIWIYTVF